MKWEKKKYHQIQPGHTVIQSSQRENIFSNNGGCTTFEWGRGETGSRYNVREWRIDTHQHLRKSGRKTSFFLFGRTNQISEEQTTNPETADGKNKIVTLLTSETRVSKIRKRFDFDTFSFVTWKIIIKSKGKINKRKKMKSSRKKCLNKKNIFVCSSHLKKSSTRDGGDGGGRESHIRGE
jgi:hypothetical protein